MFDWKRIKLVAQREIKTRIGTNSFRWSLILQVVIVALIAMSPVLIARFTGGNDDGPVSEHILVVDQADSNSVELFDATLDILGADSDTQYEVAAGESPDAVRDAVERDDADAAVIVTRGEVELEFTVITSSGDAQSRLAQMLVSASSSLALSDQIEQSGMSAEEVQQVFTAPELQLTAANPEAASNENGDEELTDAINSVVAYAGTILIFIFVMIYGQWVSQGVVEEKSSRIMEIMLNAATPRDLLAGKVIGIMVSALIQFVPMMLTLGIVASLQKQIGSLFGVPEEDLFNIDLGAIAWSTAGWFLLYFMLGYLLFGAMYAGIGSLVSRQEEVATAVAPMTTVMMVGYFAALLSLSNPDGMIARIFFIFPGTAPFVALLRLVAGNPEWWEIALSIGLLLVAIVLAMIFAARLYRVGVLMYGQPPKISEVFKLRNAEGVAR